MVSWTRDGFWTRLELSGFADGLDVGDEKRKCKDKYKTVGLSSWVISVSTGRVDEEQAEEESLESCFGLLSLRCQLVIQAWVSQPLDIQGGYTKVGL